MKLAVTKICLAFASVGCIAVAHATVLLPDVPSSEVEKVDAPYGGTLLDTAIYKIKTKSFNGIARAAVYRSESGLDFYYQYSNGCCTLTGTQRLAGFSFATLGSMPVEVFQVQRAFGIFLAGIRASDFADRTNQGEIGFNFLPITSGVSRDFPAHIASFTQVVRTRATTYTAGTVGFFDIDGIGDRGRAFAPSVPEPETYAMFLVGLGFLGTLMRRRKAAQTAKEQAFV